MEVWTAVSSSDYPGDPPKFKAKTMAVFQQVFALRFQFLPFLVSEAILFQLVIQTIDFKMPSPNMPHIKRVRFASVVGAHVVNILLDWVTFFVIPFNYENQH